MGPGSSLIVVSFIVVAFLALALSAAAWRRSRSPGSLYYAWAMVSVAIWLICTAAEATSPLPESKILWAKMSYIGIAGVGTLWLLFALDYVYPESRRPQQLKLLWKNSALLLIIPLITFILVISNELHGLIWSNIKTSSTGSEYYLIYEHGPWFYLFMAYSYLELAAGAAALVAGFRRGQIQPARLVGLMVGLALPWVGNILYVTRNGFQPGVDLTPYALALTGLIYAWLLFRHGLFESPPLAYEAVLENITEGFLVVDTFGVVIDINAACCTMLHYERSKVIGQPFSSLSNRWPVLAKALLSEPGKHSELVISGEPAQTLEISCSRWVDRSRQRAGNLLILRDITPRKQAEAKLRESEHLYKLVVNSAPVGIILIDTKGIITFASPNMVDLYQTRGLDEIVGQSSMAWIAESDRPLAQARFQSMVMHHVSLPPEEYRLSQKNGGIIWTEVTAVPVLNEEGETKSVLAILRDVTPRKAMEVSLKNNLERQTLINDLLRILFRPHNLNQALSKVLEYIGNFTGASRVYLCEDSQDASETSILFEWCNTKNSSRSREIALVNYGSIPSWRKLMDDLGQVAFDDISDAPEDLSEFFRTWAVVSSAAFPVYGSEERTFGFLAIDYCENQNRWNAERLDLLRMVSQIISGTVAQIQVEAAERRQRALAEALHDTSSALNSTLNLEEVLDRILSNLERVAAKVSANIVLVDDDGMARFVRWRGYAEPNDDEMRKLRFRANDRLTFRTMAETGEPIIIEDTWIDKRWDTLQKFHWIRSYAGVPVRARGKLVGFINLDSPEPYFFPKDLAYSLHVFADQAAVAIENARLFDNAHRQAEEMSILYRIGATLTAGLEMDKVMIALFDECRQVLPIDAFYVALYDAETNMIEMPIFYNENGFQDIPPRSIITHSGITGVVIQKRRTMYLPDILDPNCKESASIIWMTNQRSRSYVGVPLILLDKVVGVISVQSLDSHAYSADQIRLLETIATQAAIAVQNASLYDQMKQMAITDSVTGLFTRRHFTQLGQREVDRALRYDRRLSVLMVDIDHFKRVNDTYGHNTGDQVLMMVAVTCRMALRATDIVGRWGGEEFAIVLPEADRDGAALIAERIRRMMADSKMELGKNVIQVTVSIGVVTLGESCGTMEMLIDHADRALYLAKQGGRNQVQFVGCEPTD